ASLLCHDTFSATCPSPPPSPPPLPTRRSSDLFRCPAITFHPSRVKRALAASVPPALSTRPTLTLSTATAAITSGNKLLLRHVPGACAQWRGVQAIDGRGNNTKRAGRRIRRPARGMTWYDLTCGSGYSAEL